MRLLLLTRPFERRFMKRIRELLIQNAECVEVHFHRVNGRLTLQSDDIEISTNEIGSFARTQSIDAALLYSASSDVHEIKTLEWGKFDRPRIWWDEDFLRNEPVVGLAPTAPGRWSDAFYRHSLTHAVCMGKRTTEVIGSKGIKAFWIPKACDTDIFEYRGDTTRTDIVSYGRGYPVRQLALARLSRQKIYVRQMGILDYHDLPESLNLALASLAITCELQLSSYLKPLKVLGPRLSNKALRIVGSSTFGREFGQPIEPMIKVFESASCGAVPIVDYQPELAELGFLDGVNSIQVRSTVDLVERCRQISDNPEMAIEMGKRAASLVRERHDWRNRVEELMSLIRTFL